MNMVGFIIKVLTFPGAYLHGYWEHIMCKTYDCPVDDNRYFTKGEMCGHVEHEFFPTTARQFLFCFFPMLFNLFLGFAIGIPAVIRIFFVGGEQWYHYVMLWLGISFLTNLFPLIDDAMAMWEGVYGTDKNIFVKIIAAPIYAIIYAGAYLNTWGLTLITSAVALYYFPLIGILFV